MNMLPFYLVNVKLFYRHGGRHHHEFVIINIHSTIQMMGGWGDEDAFASSWCYYSIKLHLAELWCSWTRNNHVVMHLTYDYYLVVGLQDIWTPCVHLVNSTLPWLGSSTLLRLPLQFVIDLTPCYHRQWAMMVFVVWHAFVVLLLEWIWWSLFTHIWLLAW
jgi:hypothetical protein